MTFLADDLRLCSRVAKPNQYGSRILQSEILKCTSFKCKLHFSLKPTRCGQKLMQFVQSAKLDDFHETHKKTRKLAKKECGCLANGQEVM